MVAEEYPCYVQIGESPDSDNVIELPTECDGRILLTTIKAQFPDAIGLKFKSESGNWRGVGVSEGSLEPPIDGWGPNSYYIAVKKAGKRKMETHTVAVPEVKKNLLSDFIVLGLPYSTTEVDLKQYFETFGEVANCEVKMNPQTSKSRGFGFVRFTDEEVSQRVLDSPHTLAGRRIEVSFPAKSRGGKASPTKLFVGRLPKETTLEELSNCFSAYGPLVDVYIPNNFRGFGFVKYANVEDADKALKATHQLKGSFLNVMVPDPKSADNKESTQQKNNAKNTKGIINSNIQAQFMQSNNMRFLQGNMTNMQGNMNNLGNRMQQQANGFYYSKGYLQSKAR